MKREYVIINTPTGIVQMFPVRLLRTHEMHFLGEWKIKIETL